jgi:hypothetical protein
MEQPKTGGEKKIEEYVNRIKSGESKDKILEGLPPSFVGAIENQLQSNENKESKENEKPVIPPQYEGLNSEALDLMWTIPEYTDPEKTKQEKERKQKTLESLKQKESVKKTTEEKHQNDQQKITEIRKQLGIIDPIENVRTEEKNTISKEEKLPILNIEERKKLHGWTASYELAKIAKQQGIDLSKISREEYVDFAIQNSLAIDDNQLRVSPWQRMGTSAEEIILINREKKLQIKTEVEKAFARFCYEIKQKASEQDRFILDNIRVRQGTKDSSSWLFFGINKGLEKSNETFKSYISVKDLNILTPEKFTQFLTALRDSKYNGDVKIFQDLSEQGLRLNDQIVMHGDSQKDAEIALQVAEQFFKNELDQKSMGKDEIVNGESKSYSEILANKIKESIK